LNNEHILKMHTYLAKGLRWQQDGGSMISSLSQTLEEARTSIAAALIPSC
jgi:hypothetical protein